MAIIQMQDLLDLDNWARMNVPGVGEGNWSWRYYRDQITYHLSDRLATLTRIYGRSRFEAPQTPGSPIGGYPVRMDGL
jgi:4-alpha-glucanotransferase